MIRGIIFDCFGVLYGGSFGTLISMCPKESLDDLHDLNKQVDYGYITTAEYAEQVAALLSVTTDDVFKIFKVEHIRNTNLVDYLKTLRPTYKTALLSNVGTDTMETLFSLEEQQQLFDTVFLSYQEGVAKPSREAYELVAERLGLQPDECVMIDDLEQNVEGAKLAGMSGVQHVTNQQTIETIDSMLN
jgi:putative hydrolase of the HAD superfamily